MFDKSLLNSFKNQFVSAESFAVLLPPNPDADAVSSALAFYLSLNQRGKQVQIGCSSPIRVENADLFGVDKIKTSIGNQNLVISFDYQEENLKKVDYEVDENGKFMLLIQPQPGTPPPDTSTIQYSYSGANADIAIILAASSLEELGSLYSEEKSFLDNVKKISLNLTAKPGNFADFSFHTLSATCLSEITAFVLKEIGFLPTADAAANLLNTI
ncbi:hypothetical protein HY333_00930, partial [Candidatus Collierbacteria bacterium]|nr:hypothetical protein [Candidatus Collierbacteria bacterium]